MRKYKLILLPAAGGLLFWVFDSLIGSVLSQRGPVSMSFPGAGSHELHLRLFFSIALAVFLYFTSVRLVRGRAETGARKALFLAEQERAKYEAIIAALRESEMKYRTLFERAGDAIFIIELEGEDAGRIIAANQAAAEMHGYSVGEIVHMKISELDVPDSAQLVPARLDRIRKGEWIKMEVGHRRKDGSVLIMEVSAGPLDIKNRRYVLAFDRDVTERKNNEEKLRLFSVAVDEAPDGVQITDLDGVIIYSNKATEKIYGMPMDEFIGKHVNNLNDDPELAGKVIVPSLKEKGSWAGELMVKHREGRVFPIWLTTSLVRNDSGNPIAMVGIIRDISELKLAEQEREKLIDELKEALAKIKTLKGLLPICAWCKNIRDDHGYWKRVEDYVEEHSDAFFTHGICPDCLQKGDPELYEKLKSDPGLSGTYLNNPDEKEPHQD